MPLTAITSCVFDNDFVYEEWRILQNLVPIISPTSSVIAPVDAQCSSYPGTIMLVLYYIYIYFLYVISFIYYIL
jgi:hypothetical protein